MSCEKEIATNSQVNGITSLVLMKISMLRDCCPVTNDKALLATDKCRWIVSRLCLAKRRVSLDDGRSRLDRVCRRTDPSR